MSTDRRASLANELEAQLDNGAVLMWYLTISDVRLILTALRAHHSGKSDRREHWSGGEWLYPGDEIVSRSTRT